MTVAGLTRGESLIFQSGEYIAELETLEKRWEDGLDVHTFTARLDELKRLTDKIARTVLKGQEEEQFRDNIRKFGNKYWELHGRVQFLSSNTTSTTTTTSSFSSSSTASPEDDDLYCHEDPDVLEAMSLLPPGIDVNDIASTPPSGSEWIEQSSNVLADHSEIAQAIYNEALKVSQTDTQGCLSLNTKIADLRKVNKSKKASFLLDQADELLNGTKSKKQPTDQKAPASTSLDPSPMSDEEFALRLASIEYDDSTFLYPMKNSSSSSSSSSSSA